MQPLNRHFNVAVNHIASQLFPSGFDVSPNAPDSVAGLLNCYANGRLVVFDGASDQTIFADAETNFAFRAWHDHCHLRPYIRGDHAPHDFTESGETATYREQCADIFAIYGETKTAAEFVDLLRAEIIGQFRYKESLGGFPIDQRGFVELYLRDPLAALNTNFGISPAE